jgi:uncharacterized protein YkwD
MMALRPTRIASVIGKAARLLVLAPCATGRRRKSQGSRQQQSQSLNKVKAKSKGGVVLVTLPLDSDITSHPDSGTVTSDSSSSLPAKLKPTASEACLPRSSLIERNPDSDEDELTQDKTDLIMARSRRLPGTSYYSSNHIMVNRERTKRKIAPFVRMAELDGIAREHAEAMAKENRKFHSDPSSLQMKLRQPARRLGENLAKGGTIREIHREMMVTPSDANVILSSHYTHFGMATAKASDGELYLCQIFRD